MAWITRQFLERHLRVRSFDSPEVALTITDADLAAKPPTKSANQEWDVRIRLEAKDVGTQFLDLTRKDVRALAIELLRCLDTDAQMASAIAAALRAGPRERPRRVALPDVDGTRVAAGE